MKTLIVTGVALFFAINTISAQTEQDLKGDIKKIDHKEAKLKSQKRSDKITLKKLEGNDVAYRSKQQFYSDFGDVKNVIWTHTGYLDKASFTADGKQKEAFYDFDAQLVGTISPATVADLPSDAQKQIQKEYKGYTIDKVIYYDDNEANPNDMLLYGSQFDDEDSYFVELSGNGKKIVVHVTLDGVVYYFKELK